MTRGFHKAKGDWTKHPKENFPNTVRKIVKARSRERAGELRKQAERILAGEPQTIRTLSPVDIKKLIHELHVYQIELEMQNEELRRLQLELQGARDKYLNLYDFAPTGYFTLDTNGIIVDVNLTGSELLGSEKSRLIRTKFTRFISPDSQDAFHFHRREVLKTGTKGNCELKILKMDGTPFHAQLISAAISEGDGNINHCRTAIIDITERKQAEEALRKHQEHLEELVAERTKELRDAQDDLLRSERLATLGQLSGNISHELRNPLGVVDSSVYYLKRKLKDADGKVQEHLDRIKSSVDSATAVIESLLNLTRMKEPQLARLNLVAIISDAIAISKVPGAVNVTRDFPEQEVPVNADREQLRMTFKNIIKNAVEAMDGKGMLTVTSRTTDNGQAEVSFVDTGPGIATEILERVFQPLFSTKAKGIGFGLSIAKTVVERHGGMIEAKAEPGKGTNLIIRLPLSTDKDKAV
jgi:PAS domain S-box-containing protein